MKKLILLISLFVAVGCVQKEKQKEKEAMTQIKVYDDRLMNSSIFNKILYQYFSHKELDELKCFKLTVVNRNNLIKIEIIPLIQKRDTPDELPSSYLKFGEKEIFGILPLQNYLPIDNESLTILKYREMLKNLPEYVNTDGKKYPVWIINLKNNKYTIDSSLYIGNLPPSVKFVPPIIPK